MNIDAHALLGALPEPHLLVSSRGEVVAANPAAARFLSAPAEEMVGRPLAGLVEDPADRVLAYLKACSGSGSPLPGALSIRDAAGEAHRYRCQASVVKPAASHALLLLRIEPERGAARGFHLLTRQVEDLSREIRERRIAQAQTREAAARLDAVIRASPVAIVGVGPQREVTLWNPAAERMFGWSEAEVLGRPLPIVPEEQRADFDRRFVAAQRGQAVVAPRAQRRRKDGTLVEVSISSAPVLGPDGEVRFSIAMLEDVTDRLRAEEALRESEERFRVAFEQAAVGIALVGLDGRWLRVNQRLCHITGYAREELLGLTFQDITFADDLEPDLALVRRLMDGEIASFTLEKRYVRKEGGLAWVQLTTSLVRAPAGEPQYFVAVIEDIGARKRAEDELRESEAFTQRLLQSSGDCIQVLDLEARLLSLNSAGQALMQIQDFRPLFGADWLRFWEGEHHEAACGAVAAARAGGEGRFQGSWRTAAGEPKWWDVVITPVPDAEGKPFRLLVVARDISTQKEAEEALRRAKEAAEAASRAKSQFLAIMSHELRTPLTGIIGYADLLASDIWGAVNEQQRAQIARIKSGAWHLVSVIEEILTFSRVEAGKEEVHLEPVDLVRIARDSVELLEPQAAAKGVQLRVRVPEEPVEVESDPGKLRQILLNLLGNAVKFTDAGYAQLALELQDGEVRFRVTDTGPGLPVDQLERIFEPFTQVDQSHTRLKGGTGLGLAICRRLARLLGGDVGVERSTVGRGSTFVFRLPYLPVQDRSLVEPMDAR